MRSRQRMAAPPPPAEPLGDIHVASGDIHVATGDIHVASGVCPRATGDIPLLRSRVLDGCHMEPQVDQARQGPRRNLVPGPLSPRAMQRRLIAFATSVPIDLANPSGDFVRWSAGWLPHGAQVDQARQGPCRNLVPGPLSPRAMQRRLIAFATSVPIDLTNPSGDFVRCIGAYGNPAAMQGPGRGVIPRTRRRNGG